MILPAKGFDDMLYYTGLFFLVIAVSLDGFGVGLTYGMRNIKVPFLPLTIIMICSGAVVFLSMTIGNVITVLIPEKIANGLGGIILVAIGLFSFFNAVRAKIANKKEAFNHTETNRLNQFTTVITTPDQADLDKSGTISSGEALLLGIALALDAFGAGIAASMIGYGPLLTSLLIAGMSGLFIYCGMKTGIFLAKYKFLQNFSFLPPLLLIGLGILNLI